MSTSVGDDPLASPLLRLPPLSSPLSFPFLPRPSWYHLVPPCLVPIRDQWEAGWGLVISRREWGRPPTAFTLGITSHLLQLFNRDCLVFRLASYCLIDLSLLCWPDSFLLLFNCARLLFRSGILDGSPGILVMTRHFQSGLLTDARHSHRRLFRTRSGRSLPFFPGGIDHILAGFFQDARHCSAFFLSNCISRTDCLGACVCVCVWVVGWLGFDDCVVMATKAKQTRAPRSVARPNHRHLRRRNKRRQ